MRRRVDTSVGASPISWAATDAWARLMRVAPRPWEIETIHAIDDAWMAAQGDSPADPAAATPAAATPAAE